MTTTNVLHIACGFVVGILLCATQPVSAAVIYDTILNTGAVPSATTPATVSNFGNCFLSEVCIGKAGLVFDNPVSNTPLPISTISAPIPFQFPLTASQQAAIAGAPPGTVGQLFVTAARDIGIRQGANPDPDFIPTSLEGVSLGSLFQSTTSTCPPGERGATPSYPDTLVCGPNFHTDIPAMDSLTIPLSALIAAASDAKYDFALNPSETIGRLKIFSAELRISQVPEPATLALLGIALAGLAFWHRKLR